MKNKKELTTAQKVKEIDKRIEQADAKYSDYMISLHRRNCDDPNITMTIFYIMILKKAFEELRDLVISSDEEWTIVRTNKKDK